MCGIAGILHFGKYPDAPRHVEKMAISIAHRGPDEDGFWSDQDISLGFRRLAIVDIETGNQPLSNENGTVWVIYNGEIYNHRELRRELESCGHHFRTDHSDTEVLVHGWEQWGEALPKKLNGMFAFALWDRNARCLILARDRLGIKPLYVANDGQGTLLFGSEVRALHASGLIAKQMLPEGILEYLTLNNNWHGRTPFAGVRMIQPGTMEICNLEGTRTLRFWSLEFSRSNHRTPAVDAYREMLLNVMRRQMDADVPVMSYLSGGIDSTAITVAAHRLDRQVRAYSCVFNLTDVGEDRFVDERDYSRAVAAAIDINRIELELDPEALIHYLDLTIGALEYPRMGMSYVNYLIARRVAEDARVVMSGMGGDEFHGGYVGRYAITPRNVRVAGIASFFRRLRRRSQRQDSDPLGPYRLNLNFPIAFHEVDDAFTPEFLRAARGFSGRDAINDLLACAPSRDPWDIVMYADCLTYLHGLLVLEDKLSMAHSLETRVPLLDNEIIDHALSLPWDQLSDGKTGKIIFREAVKPWVPNKIYAKPKMGFAPPDASWYRGSLRSWIEDQLSENTLNRHGIIKPSYVRRKLDEHFSGRANHVILIWSLLSLESWCRIHRVA